jgi:hypothetical protein
MVGAVLQLILALVLLLGAADPTPRFLGIPRLAPTWRFAQPSCHDDGLPYTLPPAVRAIEAKNIDDVFVAAPASRIDVSFIGFEVVVAAPSNAATPAPGRSDTGPPLRC